VLTTRTGDSRAETARGMAVRAGFKSNSLLHPEPRPVPGPTWTSHCRAPPADLDQARDSHDAACTTDGTTQRAWTPSPSPTIAERPMSALLRHHTGRTAGNSPQGGEAPSRRRGPWPCRGGRSLEVGHTLTMGTYLRHFAKGVLSQYYRTVQGSARWQPMAYHIDRQSNRPHVLAESWRERASRRRIESRVRPGGREDRRGRGSRAPRSQRR